MSRNSVGAVSLDLNLNAQPFERQLSGIGRMAKKAGAMLAGAFAVKGLANFGKACIKLGSDLTEVQNVVDVTFGAMSENVNAFAQDAITAFGLSETTAKKYMGTFGAMSRAFGYSTGQAYEMSAALTGLTGDVASFYNLSTDEAYTKLKSVFTGETESLKDLGVVMTQNALDAYAMANGYGKAAAKMTEQEKVALRLAFVQDKLALASGDFSRTSGSWANQVRILSLQFDQFKATIGQGLINVFTPVIQAVNTLLAKLMALANAFRSFTAMLFGEQAQSGGAAVETMDGLSDSVEGVGDAAAGTAKQIKKSLAGFDELNVLAAPGSGGTGGAAAAGMDFSLPVEEQDAAVLSEANTQLDGMIARLHELGGLFKTGFHIGLGDVDLSSVEASIGNIKDRMSGLFNSDDVEGVAKRWVDSIALNLGKGAGALASVGATIAQNLLGGFETFLTRRGEALKRLLVSSFDVSAEMNDLLGRLSTIVADIFSAFGGENAQRITAALYQMFIEPFAHVVLLAQKFGRDLLNCIVQPLEDNVGRIKAVVDGALGPVATVLETIADTASYAFESMQALYDAHVAPMLRSFSDGMSELLGVFLDAWQAHIQPTLDAFADKFRAVVEGHVQPMIDKLSGFLGRVCDDLKVLWEELLKPLAAFIIETAAPAIGAALGVLGDVFNGLLATVSGVLGGIFDALGGLMDFITGVLTGDWEKAWSGLGDVVKGVFDGLVALVKAPLNLIIGLVNGMLGAIERGINGLIGAVNTLSFDVPEWVPGIGGRTLGFDLRAASIPRIPALAEGGYIRANTPQLAMIGDNRTQGEIVAPEGKLAELLREAVNAAGGAQTATMLSAILELVRQIAENREIVIRFDGSLSQLVRLLKPHLDERSRLQGVRLVNGGNY